MDILHKAQEPESASGHDLLLCHVRAVQLGETAVRKPWSFKRDRRRGHPKLHRCDGMQWGPY